MSRSGPHYFPVAAPFLIGLAVLAAAVIALVELGVLEYTFAKIGVARQWIYALLALSLLGSWVNVPAARIASTPALEKRQVRFCGVRYVVPAHLARPRTIVAVNLGGAVVPVLLSLRLLATTGGYVPGIGAAALVAAVTYGLARPLRGVGIAVPLVVPPLLAAAAALLLAPQHPAATAYVAGTLGTLVGADLLHLKDLRTLDAPVVSIGGAGTFDGIFLSGVLAVLLA
jgi:uncharacterized membrane protein